MQSNKPHITLLQHTNRLGEVSYDVIETRNTVRRQIGDMLSKAQVAAISASTIRTWR